MAQRTIAADFARRAAASVEDGGRHRRYRRIAPGARRSASSSMAAAGSIPATSRAAPKPVLDGGSLYWVIRGQIRVRQRITGFRSERDDKGRAYCLIEVEPLLVATLWRPWRPFQGWRYLTACRRAAGRARRLEPAGCRGRRNARAHARRAARPRFVVGWGPLRRRRQNFVHRMLDSAAKGHYVSRSPKPLLGRGDPVLARMWHQLLFAVSRDVPSGTGDC